MPSTYSSAFEESYIEYATLHVPTNALNDYKTTTPWSGFGTIKSLEGGDQPEEPEVKICATPTISYKEGKLVFACETEGAEFISEITCDDIRKHYEAEVPLTTTYTVTVRATKVGYDDSETATATLCWIECTHENVEGDDSYALTTIPAMRLLVQAQPGGVITLQGATATLPVAIFTTDGTQVASGTLEPDATLSLATGLSAGEVAVVKLGVKSVKVMVE